MTTPLSTLHIVVFILKKRGYMHSPTISTIDTQNNPTVTYTEFVCNGIVSLATFSFNTCSIRKFIAVFANEAVTHRFSIVFILINFNNALPNSNEDSIFSSHIYLLLTLDTYDIVVTILLISGCTSFLLLIT